MVGVINSTAAASTLNTGDTINGNGSTIVTLTLNGNGGGNGVTPIADVNNVAVFNLNVASNGAADSTLNMVEFDGVAQVAVSNGTNGQTAAISNAQLDTIYSINKSRSITVDINSFEDATGAADSVTLTTASAGNTGGNATFSLSDTAVETVSLVSTGTNYLTVTDMANTDTLEAVISGTNDLTLAGLDTATAVTIAAAGTNTIAINDGVAIETFTFTGSGTNDITIGAAAATMLVDASGTTGANTIDIGALLTSLDTIEGGSGADELIGDINAGLTRATISGVETLTVDFGVAGATLDLRNVTGATTLNLTGDETATVTRAASTIQTINLLDVVNTADASVTYAAGSNSAVDLHIGGTGGVDAGAITLATNTGALTVHSIEAANTANSITANSVSSIEVHTHTALNVDAAGADISATAATTATLITAGGALTVADDVIVTAATSVTVDAAEGAIVITGDLTTSADAALVVVEASVDNVTIGNNLVADGDGAEVGVAASGGNVGIVGDIVATGSSAIVIEATAGSVTIGDDVLAEGENAIVDLLASGGDADDIVVTGTLAAINFAAINAAAAGGADIVIGDILVGADTVDTTSHELNLEALGAGTTVNVADINAAAGGVLDLVTITTDADGSASLVVDAAETNLAITEIDASASAGTTIIDLGGADLAGAGGVDVTTGSGGSLATLTADADTFVGGSGVDEVWGMDGADDITLGGGADVVGFTTNVTSDTVGDFVAGAAGDEADFSIGDFNDILALLGVMTQGDGVAIDAGDAGLVTSVTDVDNDISTSAANVYALTGTTFNSLADVEDALIDGGAISLVVDDGVLDDDGFFFAWQDNAGNTHLSLVEVAVTAIGATATVDTATATDVALLVGVQVDDFVSANFGMA